MTLRFSICLLLVSVALPSESMAQARRGADRDVKHTVRRKSYLIEGVNAAELNASMKKNSPKKFNAYTNWEVVWTVSTQTRGSATLLKSFSIQVKSLQTLPNWKKPKDVSTEMLDEWDRYVAALKKHEEGHSRFGLDAAKEMRNTVQAKRWIARSPDELAKLLSDHCNAILKKHRSRELDYDRTTGHGVTQGAVLRQPPEKPKEDPDDEPDTPESPKSRF